MPTPAAAQGTSTTGRAAGVALPSAIFAGDRSSSPAATQEYASSQASSHDGGPPKLNLTLAPTPIQESEEERKAALAKMQQTLQLAPTPGRRGTMRGRRGDRHTMQATASETPLPANHMAALANIGDSGREDDDTPLANIQQGLRQRPASSVSSPNPFESPSLQGGSGIDATSNQAGSSLFTSTGPSGGAVVGGAAAGAAAGLAGAAVLGNQSSDQQVSPAQATSPFAQDLSHGQPTSATATAQAPALRATIVETVQALMKDKQALQTTVTGEIFFALGATAAPSSTPVHVKLSQFDALDSIAPNPTFLSQVPDSPGEYFLNTQALSQAPNSGDSRGTLLFQYQALVPEGSDSLTPVGLNPAFQIKEGETRMILHYHVAPSAAVADLSLGVLFAADPAVTNTQSKPVAGTWSEVGEDRLVLWKPEISADGKIITRFLTSPGAPGLIPKSVDAHFVCPGKLVSGIDLETVDGSSLLEGVNRMTVSGKYTGETRINT